MQLLATNPALLSSMGGAVVAAMARHAAFAARELSRELLQMGELRLAVVGVRDESAQAQTAATALPRR